MQNWQTCKMPCPCSWGRKRWFMYPPDVMPNFHPNRTTLQWLIEDYPKLKDDQNLFECTLAPGEVS